MGGEDEAWKAESKDDESVSVRMRGGRMRGGRVGGWEGRKDKGNVSL